MDIEQIHAAAEEQSSSANESSSIRICIASSAADPTAAHILGLFQNAIGCGRIKATALRTGSFGLFDLEPIVIVEIAGRGAALHRNAIRESVASLISDLERGREPCGSTGAFCRTGTEGVNGVPHISELPLFKLQNRIALRNCGWIDPDDINDYVRRAGGYTGLSEILRTERRHTLEAVLPSVLKGRGAPGCSTFERWMQFTGSGKAGGHLICNAVDPDPRSLISRFLLENDPHSVLEGMLIAALTAGASNCILLVQESAEAYKRLSRALEQMRTCNLLGSNILGSEFSSEIRIDPIPPSVTSGQGIELFRCFEEGRTLPHMLPSYPAASEIGGNPVLIVNPETLASLSAVLCGQTAGSTGSKVVTFSGIAAHNYVVEVPSGTTIRSAIDILGGGVSNGKSIKAVQLGGPSGKFLATEDLDLVIGCNESEESLSSVGSGTIEILGGDSDIPDAVKEDLVYLQTQSCGKCVFCREGCLQILTILEDISENKSKPQDLDLLVAVCAEMKTGCLCGFGRAVPDPVLTSIKLFRDEYESKVPGKCL